MLSERVFSSIYQRLKEIDVVFSEMWRKQRKMVFRSDVETVELTLENEEFFIVANESYWKRLKFEDRIFIICHEYCHLILGHWLGGYSEWKNIAQDIEVNEYLTKNYSVKIPKSACTLELVFKDKSYKVERNREYTYYLELIMKCLPDSEKSS